MRKYIALALTFVLLFALASCSLPFGESDTPVVDESATEHTYVITTRGLTGLYRMAEGIQWRENTMCALQYIGTRDTYTEALHNMYQERFTDIDEDSFGTLRQVNAGGNDVYLVVPRFDLLNISVFGVQTDSEGEVHVLKQYADLDEPFLLFCNGEGDGNVQLSAVLPQTNQHYKLIPLNVYFTEAYSFPGGYQPIENS